MVNNIKIFSKKKNQISRNRASIKYKKYWDYNWRMTRNIHSKYPVCNWCYYYVFEYR